MAERLVDSGVRRPHLSGKYENPLPITPSHHPIAERPYRVSRGCARTASEIWRGASLAPPWRSARFFFPALIDLVLDSRSCLRIRRYWKIHPHGSRRPNRLIWGIQF
jgi:hypothetical protein